MPTIASSHLSQGSRSHMGPPSLQRPTQTAATVMFPVLISMQDTALSDIYFLLFLTNRKEVCGGVGVQTFHLSTPIFHRGLREGSGLLWLSSLSPSPSCKHRAQQIQTARKTIKPCLLVCCMITYEHLLSVVWMVCLERSPLSEKVA